MHFKTEINADPGSVRDVIVVVIAYLKDELEYAEEFVVNVEIVLAELLNNIVEHGYGGQNKGLIRLTVTATDYAISCETQDFGMPMPNLMLPQCDLRFSCQDYNTLPEGGFGWFLIKSLASNLRYQRVADKNRFYVELKASSFVGNSVAS